MSLDPGTLLYNRIVKVLKERAESKYRIIDWNSTRSPQPDVASQQDLPEWQVRPAGTAVRLGARSCATEVERSYSLVHQTGNNQLQKYYEGEWALLKALHALQFTKLDDLEYNERPFVENVAINGIVQGIIDPVTGRKIAGWGALYTITILTSHSPSDFLG